jgi:hypothetical protein
LCLDKLGALTPNPMSNNLGGGWNMEAHMGYDAQDYMNNMNYNIGGNIPYS